MLSWQPNYLLQLPARMAKIEKIQVTTIRQQIEKIRFTTVNHADDGGHVGKIPAKIWLGAGHSAPKFLAKRAKLLSFDAAPDKVNHLVNKYTYITVNGQC
jgi:hypothetical protein